VFRGKRERRAGVSLKEVATLQHFLIYSYQLVTSLVAYQICHLAYSHRHKARLHALGQHFVRSFGVSASFL